MQPDGVEVSADRRMVSMSWNTDDEGVLRLDQFDATLDFSVLKTAPDVQYAAVNDIDALWFEEPHEVALLEPDGTQVTHSARLAGHTLIWHDGRRHAPARGRRRASSGRSRSRSRPSPSTDGNQTASGGVPQRHPSTRR